MTPRERRADLAAARYLEAVERDDFDTMAELWRLAGTDPDLEAALHETHAGLLEEQRRKEQRAEAAVARAARAHLGSGEVVADATAPLTVADVAEALFRRPPPRLPAGAHALNEALRAAAEPLPEHLGLSRLIAWAEARFGEAPVEYWVAFRQAALELDLRRASEAEFRMAARRAPRPEDRP